MRTGSRSTRPPESPARGHAHAALVSAARELSRLDERLVAYEKKMLASIDLVPEDRRESARNLVHYLALRQLDLRDLQGQLALLGLSSLGRSEGCVRWSLQQVARRVRESLALYDNAGIATAAQSLRSRRALALLESESEVSSTPQYAEESLHRYTRELLGPRPDDRHVYIMVTAASAREADRAWMSRALRSGMNVLRINCAHEGPEQWQSLLEALGEARSESGGECRVLMDLAGPKIRTGPVAGKRRIATWKPTKDEIGRVTAPARVVLRRGTAPDEASTGIVLTLEDEAFEAIRRGDELRFRDAQNRKRTLDIVEVRENELTATATRRAYLVDGTRARVVRKGRHVAEARLGVQGSGGATIEVMADDELVLTARAVKGTPPRRDRAGRVARRGVISCAVPEALDLLDVEHRVLFDDGRIEAIVVKADKKRGDYVLRVVRTQKPTIKLHAEKGINLPDTVTRVSALTEEDLQVLPFVAKHADAVSLSFVRTPDDVRMLRKELDRLGAHEVGVVLKIETRTGFENLPHLLLEGLRRPPLGVMIARGDLAVEVGFERLAELQEEILWLCEASHVPAIWATQVLDTLARTGVPSRAEVTDAANSVAAECVMLNKGPFVDEAVRVLSDILRRMEKHRYKKRSLFRRLRVSMPA